MAIRSIRFDEEAHAKIAEGVSIIAKAVGSTMGPRGRAVAIATNNPFEPVTFTVDGVTVANHVELSDPLARLGADAVKNASRKTNDIAGDGPQPLYSLVLTPSGFVPMGEITEGMEICGTNGTIQKVVGVFDKGIREIYRVTLTDGRVVECCDNHLWSVSDNEGRSKTLTVRELIDSGRIGRIQKDGSTKHGFFIQKTQTQFTEKKEEQPLDPYTLGVLLGDGSLSGTGTIELSLGFKKRHILKKLELPAGTLANASDCEKYIRVKLAGKQMRVALEKLSLYGTKSETKFIPKSYLYSSFETRRSLLQGLLDTDGYINDRGLFEFSTVSTVMASDFIELCRGLGHELYTVLHTRENDKDSYSKKSIFRILQLKGNKYGMAIDSIEPTGEKTEMRCIKVSNSDNLYITDDYVVTHNTTTAAVLAHAIYTHGRRLVNNGENPMKVKADIERETKEAVEALKAMSRPVNDAETLVRVATISSKDAELGKLVASVVSEAGEDGLITVEAAPIFGVETEITKGFKLDTGFVQPWMVTDPQRNVTVMEEATILVTDGNVDKDIAHLMNRLLEKGTKRLVIVADGFSPDALATMYTNGANGKFVCVGIRNAGVGDHRKKESLRDLCAAIGAILISEETGKTLKEATPELCGKARQVTVGKDYTVIVEGAGKQEDVDIRLSAIRAEMVNEKSEYNLTKFKERISRLTGIAGVIKVGGTNEAETKEKKQRVEDAVNAVKAAKTEGILPGGGTSLLGVSVDLSVLREALQEPLRCIAENAGYNPDVVLSESLKLPSGEGLNVSTGEWGDLIAMGVVDPTRVTRIALLNASSVASLLLVTDVLIVDEPPKP